VARANQFFDADGQHRHAVFVAFDFLGNADNHAASPDRRRKNGGEMNKLCTE
jgi:hypothetical protein